jgi:hypothetical protein
VVLNIKLQGNTGEFCVGVYFESLSSGLRTRIDTGAVQHIYVFAVNCGVNESMSNESMGNEFMSMETALPMNPQNFCF